MSVYFNSANNLSGDMSDCLYSDSTGIKHIISSIWGTKDNDVVKLWGKNDNKIEDPYAVAPASGIDDWDYTWEDVNNTITLRRYKGSASDVIVYSNYEIDGKTYRTKIASNTTSDLTSKPFDKVYMFESVGRNIKSIAFGNNIDFSEVVNMAFMFSGCYNLKNIDFGDNFNTKYVKNMSFMFSGCKALLNLDLSNFNTSNVTDMSYIFQNCSSLISLDLSNFNTSNVTDMSSMFSGCKALLNLDLSNFNTSNVTDMSSMFRECSALRALELENFDTVNVTNMYSMFQTCSSLSSLNLSSFNTINVTDMVGMFAFSRNLVAIYVDQNLWLTTQANMSDMFRDCGTSSVTYK